MQIKTWFAIFTLDKDGITDVKLFRKDIDGILERIISEPVLLRGKINGEDVRDLAVKYGFVTSLQEYDSMLHEVNIRLARKNIEKAVTSDRLIIAAVEAIDDIDETVNILAERLREWYILVLGETDLKGKELAVFITEMIEPRSEVMSCLASSLLGLYDSRLLIEEYIKENMQTTAPNLTNVAGYLLGARLLSKTGSIEKLASMPSSTVQVIGADSALFKHLKGKIPSPKHGLIFRHPLINSAPRKLRGKISRAVASKISLAARYDCYSDKIDASLPSELERKVAGIRKRSKN